MKKRLSRTQQLKLKAKNASLKFRKEFRKSIATALIAAFGLIIAFSWKDVINLWVEEILSLSPIKNSLLSAIIVTIFCVLGILIVSKTGNEAKK